MNESVDCIAVVSVDYTAVGCPLGYSSMVTVFVNWLCRNSLQTKLEVEAGSMHCMDPNRLYFERRIVDLVNYLEETWP